MADEIEVYDGEGESRSQTCILCCRIKDSVILAILTCLLLLVQPLHNTYYSHIHTGIFQTYKQHPRRACFECILSDQTHIPILPQNDEWTNSNSSGSGSCTSPSLISFCDIVGNTGKLWYPSVVVTRVVPPDHASEAPRENCVLSVMHDLMDSARRALDARGPCSCCLS